jgi:hypothetical protein
MCHEKEFPPSGGVVKHLANACLIALSLSAIVAMPARADDAETAVLASHGLLSQLESFLQQRELDTTTLTADSMVGVMIDWMRFSAAGAGGGTAPADALIYQYGGWSEGCATGFKFSLLRKVSALDPSGENFAQTAGITLIFEPSANTDLAPYKLVSSDLTSIDAFMAAIEGSPAFRKLASTTPMSVVVESGGMR